MARATSPKSLSTTTNHVANLPPEEPDAGNLHVRVCEGASGQPLALLGGIFAAGDIALYPNPVLGGMRREEHWDAALAMGRAAGYNMAAKKMVNFTYIPWHRSSVFDLDFDFVGDFTRTPTRVELEGDRNKKRKFMLKCYQLNKLTGVVFCNEDEKKVKAVRADFAKMIK